MTRSCYTAFEVYAERKSDGAPVRIATHNLLTDAIEEALITLEDERVPVEIWNKDGELVWEKAP
jgi:hypothetical protein